MSAFDRDIKLSRFSTQNNEHFFGMMRYYMSDDNCKEKFEDGILNYIEKQQLLNIKGRSFYFKASAESYKPSVEDVENLLN